VASFPEYENYDALGLAGLVRDGELRARELVDAAIERIEARNPKLNAVVATSFERARSQADAVDQRRGEGRPGGSLAGVPFLLKDLKAYDAGQPVSNGSRMWAGFRPREDDELVRRFKAAGLIICGRTNTPELGILGVTEPEVHGPTRNPWDLERTPGGSSGGAGAAVASGMVPAAHASDGGGSIRIPASNCGLFGLKPTRDRIPLQTPDSSWGGLATHHVLTRSVRDCAALLDALEGRSPGQVEGLESPEVPFAQQLGEAPSGLRIALCTDALLADDTHPDCVEAAEQAAKLCESLGHTVTRAKPRFDRAAMTRAYLLMVACGTAAAVRKYEGERGKPVTIAELEAKTWLLRAIGEAVSASEYLVELGRIHQASAEIRELYRDYDLLLTPTLAQPPLRVGAIHTTTVERVAARAVRAANKRVMMALLEQLASDPLAPNPNTQLFNLTGQPAMSVPLHWNGEGLPIGVQFVGRLGDEALLLQLGRQLEQAQPWAERRPTLA
jgi:amidase